MARKLKTYQTSLGFFDLAIAAPSMKAALEAWGADSNLFHQGVARQTVEPAVVAATLSKPGVILKRPVGSHGAFSEHAEVPKHLSGDKRIPKGAKARTKQKKQLTRPLDDKAARNAGLAFEREQRRRERERQKEEAARAKERDRVQRATATAQAAMEKAEEAHHKRASALERERAALDKRSKAEDARWEKQRQKLQTALRRARS
jgi:colicin import membrane protein